MEIKIVNNKIEIWETNRKKNELLYEDDKCLNNYKRKDLANFELLLREYNQTEEADKIKMFLSKIIRLNSIPNLIPTSNDVSSVRLSHLKDVIKEHTEKDALNLNPDFQRNHVWTTDQRIKYIEFILQGGKTSPIWFNHEGWMTTFEGEMVIVDGKQRLTSLLMFLDNKIPIFKELDKENIGYYAKHFDNLSTTVTLGVNNLPNKKLVLEWYYQLNSGYIQHTDEELNKVKQMIDKYGDV
ncbi:DUF262 domain-containing protein [Clostridiaceae bacterium HSG29]|nr:DUF262 domain-containing protein [Clostridiaceae bacterium HSG29]